MLFHGHYYGDFITIQHIHIFQQIFISTTLAPQLQHTYRILDPLSLFVTIPTPPQLTGAFQWNLATRPEQKYDWVFVG